jgi:hypothetical protein
MLDGEIPLLHHRVAEVRCKRPELQRRYREAVEYLQGISTGNRARPLTIGEEGIRLEQTDGSRAIQLRREIERSRLAAIRIAALVFFAAIKYPIGGANNRLPS